MSRRPRSNNSFLKGVMLALSNVFSGVNISNAKMYIVSTKRERHTRHPRMEHHHSRAKAAKRNRNKIKRRSH